MFEEMAKSPAAWLSGQGDESMVVLSTRVRLARNVAGASFPPQADDETKQRIISYFDSAITRSDILSDGDYFKAADINGLDRQFLIERHLISPVFLDGDTSKAVFIGRNQRVSIMVNEEDHLRIQACPPGSIRRDPTNWHRAVRKRSWQQYLEFDYDPDFGYLTACPTNAGTGMRASVLIHLPGLSAHARNRESDLASSPFGPYCAGVLRRRVGCAGKSVPGFEPEYAGYYRKEEIINQITRVTLRDIDEEAAARQSR
jgi:protein arginine kinase